MTERMIQAGDATLCTETFGAKSDPAVLLIGGAAASMDWWDPAFCQRLADAGRFVVRYDHRDTGRSTSYPAGSPGDTAAALGTDALAGPHGLGGRRPPSAGASTGRGTPQRL